MQKIEHYTSGYRPEVDGLRAISAILGILFHLGLASFNKGFLALEIFFVISGYLITKLLLNEYERSNNLNFKSFYFRRARRLLPALFSTVFFTMIFGYFILPQDYIKEFANSIIHTLVGISNFQFYFEADYFDISSKLKPLLHTWSLGVEEQFYLLWPIFTLIYLKLTKTVSKMMNIVFITLILLAFALLTFSFKSETSLTFYLMPFRVFEFLFGSIIVFIEREIKTSKLTSELLSIIGIAVISYTIFFYRPDSKELFYHSLLTCIGSFLLVLFSQTSRGTKKILGAKPLVLIGKASYSIYLIHWPIISFFRHLAQRSPDIIESIVIILLTFILGFIQYYLVEKKFRTNKSGQYYFSKNNPFLVYFTILIPIIIFANGLSHGSFQNNSNALIPLAKKQRDHDRFLAEWDLACFLGDEKNPKRDTYGKKICKPEAKNQVLTIGNSHEFDSYLTFRRLFSEGNPDINLVYSSLNSYQKNVCKFYFDEQDQFRAKNPKCKKVEEILQDYKTISSKFNTIIIGAFGLQYEWANYLIKYATKLQSINPKLKIIIHGSLLTTSDYHCFDMINRFNDPKACNKKQFIRLFNPNEESEIREQYPKLKFTYLDRIDLFCPKRTAESCQIFINDMPIFFDAHHFNYHGIMEQVRRIKERPDLLNVLEQALQK